MRTRLASALLLALLPFAASAQQLVPDAPAADAVTRAQLLDRLLDIESSSARAPMVLPLWQRPDGHIMAAVALGADTSPLEPKAPQVSTALDWRVVDATALLSSELRFGSGSRVHADAHLSELALPAAGAGGMTECLGVPAWLGNGGCATGYAARWHAGSVDAGWSNGDSLSFGLGYALSSFDGGGNLALAANTLGTTMAPLLGGSSNLPQLILPLGALQRFDSSSQFGAYGRFRFGAGESLDLAASLGRIRLVPEPNALHPISAYNQAALSLGLDHGPFSGNITGRLLSPQGGYGNAGWNHNWTSIDLGVSWRTPWRGELRVGAQNLWTSPPVTGEDVDAQSRVPYVQYHQDL